MNGEESAFIDTSGFKALFDFKDDFHNRAEGFWKKAQTQRILFVTTNYVLDETFTLIRSQMGKEAALEFRNDLLESTEQIKIVRITVKDEKEAWKFFKKLPSRRLSFTDCISFSVMKRYGLKKAFTFDKDFRRAGFTIIDNF